MVIDHILTFILQLSQAYVIFPFLILGIIFVDRKLFIRIAVLLLLGICVNLLFKNLVQAPLKPHLPKGGYAFPSGHAQLTATFYGYLAYTYRHKLLTWIMGLIIGGTLIALVHFNYHDWVDVLGALGVAAVWIYLFEALRLCSFFKDRFYFFTFLFLPLVVLLEYTTLKLPANYFMVSGSYVGICLGLWIEHHMGYGKYSKLVEALIIGVGSTLLYGLIMGALKAHFIPQRLGLLILCALPVGWVICGPGIVTFFQRRNSKAL